MPGIQVGVMRKWDVAHDTVDMVWRTVHKPNPNIMLELRHEHRRREDLVSRSLCRAQRRGGPGPGRLVVLTRVLTPQKVHEVSEGMRKSKKT
ncbi:hypothetical protein E2C01_015743 [Portunus trituberculatus]|uniref:Uncharacterized protein n=1 Tax=Portunus trituberculatus TaxID=210409 RepID=A0A5B7DMC1_PORTR|nr:hypothetical protein [Portunus trituberculatus]